jgi:hypothetical protein
MCLPILGYVVALGWISNCMPRPPAKRAAALAAINAVSNTSSIYASYMFPSSAGPRYGKFTSPDFREQFKRRRLQFRRTGALRASDEVTFALSVLC